MEKYSPFEPVISDETTHSKEYLEALERAKKTFKKSLKIYKKSSNESLKKNKGQEKEEDEDLDEEDQQMLAEIDALIQQVLTENQKDSIYKNMDTLNKKGRLSRGDVRNVFNSLLSKNSLEVSKTKPRKELIADDCEIRKVASFKEKNLRLPRNGVYFGHSMDNLKEPKKEKINNSYSPSNSTTRSPTLIVPPPDYSDDEDFSHIKNYFSSKGISKNEIYIHQNSKSLLNIHFLSESDFFLLKVFAETEIRTLFKENGNIKFNKLQIKHKEKHPDRGVIGVPLQKLLDRDKKKIINLRVPIFVTTLISKLEEHVNEEGILRVSGSLTRIRETSVQLETDNNYIHILHSLSPHDLSGVLKHFIRSLPFPLFTLEWLDAFCKATTIKEEEPKLKSFQTLMCLLPDVNRCVLQLLFELLLKIASFPNNRMSLENVTMVISPTLFQLQTSSPVSSSYSDKMMLLSNEVENLNYNYNAVLYILKNNHLVWMIPNLLLSQVRSVGLKTNKRTKKNKFTHIKKINLKTEEPENSFTQIIIHSLHPDYKSQTHDLNPFTSVKDVLLKFNKFKENDFENASTLFESGTFIGQRALAKEENITSLIKINPQVKFSFCKQSPQSLIYYWPPKLFV